MPGSSPCVMDGTTVGSVSTMASTWLPTAAATAGAPPVNGTCRAWTLATSRKKYSAPICGPVPTPALALGLAVLDELPQILGWIAGMNGKHIRAERHDGDGAQILG